MVFFSSRRRHTRWTGDWSSDVCSSDLTLLEAKAATGDIDGPAYWTAVVGQQELGLSRDQLYRSRQRLRSLSSGSWHCCLSLRVSAMVIAPTRLDLFILAPVYELFQGRLGISC